MIVPSLDPLVLPAERSTDVVLSLLNTGVVACINLVLEFELSRGLVLARGKNLVEIDRLDAGQHHEHSLRIRAEHPGSGGVHFPNFSYRDVTGRTHDGPSDGIELTVSAAPVAAVESAATPTSAFSSAPSVFVSYRRPDSEWFVHRLVASLRRHLRPARVFVDDAIGGGEKWRVRLDSELVNCSALVAVIGPNWSGPGMGEVLKWEIATALRREVPIILVLFDRDQVPGIAELPIEIRGVVEWQAEHVDVRHFNSDVLKIVFKLQDALRPSPRGRH